MTGIQDFIPFPTTRDMDNMNNTVKQIISFPTMAINNMLDNTNNMMKNATMQMQSAMQNIPLPPVPILPNMTTPGGITTPTSPPTLSAQIRTPSNVITAQSINPVKPEGPLTI